MSRRTKEEWDTLIDKELDQGDDGSDSGSGSGSGSSGSGILNPALPTSAPAAAFTPSISKNVDMATIESGRPPPAAAPTLMTRMPSIESGRLPVALMSNLQVATLPTSIPSPPTPHFTWMPRTESGRPSLPQTTVNLQKPILAASSSAITSITNNSVGEIFRLNVTLHIKPERRKEFLQCILNNQNGTLTLEPLAISYVFGEDTTKSNTFHFVEAYHGERGFEEHQAAPHFAEWEKFASTNPFTAPPEIQFFKEFRQELQGDGGKEGGALKTSSLKTPSLD